MFSNPFQTTEKIEINHEADIIFVSDLFVENYSGGAELTSQAIIDSCPLRVQKLMSKEATTELLEKGCQASRRCGSMPRGGGQAGRAE